MLLSLGRWRLRHLSLATVSYWAALAAVKLTPAFIAAWKVTRDGEHGSINAALGDGTLLKVTILRDAAVMWSGAVSLATLALWVAGPPLLLWLFWLIAASRTRRDERSAPAQLERGDVMPTSQTGRAGDEVPISRRDARH
jgi:Na+-transporting NADH:ubiquinone oxidoreductase subunit NqrB